ncbi:hypothetical protein Arcve_1379 [Archaeoglobus veneficus SNP6]|uniref:Uncharacterized protein n=2 Tax=Archaeoglobus veneficus TaxID=58290 RepID=F2KNI1_ARCVS|nr:hypothetical protein Arcve_1379 [Archaeoglobus veneficus SNP6]
METYPDLKSDIAKFVRRIFNDVSYLSEKRVELTIKDAIMLMKKIGDSSDIHLILSSTGWRSWIWKLIQDFESDFNKRYQLRLSTNYKAKLILILTSSPGAVLEFLKFITTPIFLDEFAILRDFLEISGVISGIMDGVQVYTIPTTKLFDEIPNSFYEKEGRIFKVRYLKLDKLIEPVRVISELNFRLYYALINDLERGILNQNFFENVEKLKMASEGSQQYQK